MEGQMPPKTEDPVSQPYPQYPQPNYPLGPPPAGQPQWPTQQPGYQQGPPPGQQYPPGYGQQPYAPQGYGQAPPPPVQHEFAQGSLDAFYAQPRAGGGGGLKFPQAGVGHMIIVNRGLVDGDTEQQTDMETNTIPQVDKKGQPKFVLKVPVNVVIDANNPEGVAKWYLQGGAVDDLARAQALAGSTAPPGLPEAGSAIWVQLTGKRKAGNFQANTWDIRYWRPGPDAQSIAAQYGIVYPELSAAGQQATLERENAAVAQVPAQVQAAQNGQAPQPPHLVNAPATPPIPEYAPQLQTPPGAPPVHGPQYPVQPLPAQQTVTQQPPPVQAPPVQQYAPQVAPQPQVQGQLPPQAPPAPADIASLPPEKQALYGQLTGAPQG